MEPTTILKGQMKECNYVPRLVETGPKLVLQKMNSLSLINKDIMRKKCLKYSASI